MIPHEDEETYPPARLLVVDDSPANRLALSALLEPLGHEVAQARSGREALGLAREQEFAVILLDVNMPGMDGFETIEALRRERLNPQTPVIFLSAVHDGLHFARRALSLGAIDYVAKPFDPDLLRDKVGALASLYRRGKELRRRADIIERKEYEITAARVAIGQAEAERLRSERENRLKDRFIGMLGHDLRNPLNVIAMTAQGMAAAPDLPERHQRAAQRMIRSADRMAAMIRDLLDFTRGQLGGGIPITRASVDFGPLCESVLEELRVLHPSRDVRLRKEGELTGKWDGERLQQVVSNLVANAIQHGLDPVHVSVKSAPDQLLLEVHNAGKPIPDHELQVLFEPFRRGGAGERSEGLGLGLYIVKEIVRAHGGSVEARSTTEDGTRFICLLPR